MIEDPMNILAGASIRLDENNLKMLTGSFDTFDTEDEVGRLTKSSGSPVEVLEHCKRRLRRAAELTKEILTSINEGIIVCDRQFRCRVWNRFMEDLTGLRAGDVLGKSLLLPTLPPFFGKQGIHSMMARALDGGFWNEECGLRNPASGQSAWYSCAYGPHRNVAGDSVGTIVLVQDITEQKEHEQALRLLERQLRQAQKMEAIGTLSAGIAHDFNNILTPITGYTELAISDMQDGVSPCLDYLEEILHAAHRAASLVKQILTFSRQSEQEKQPLRLSSIINESIKLLRASLPSTIEIRQDLDGRRRILGDPTQIQQVLMNLCANAGHAMGRSGGTLTISLNDVYFSSSEIAGHPGLRPGPYIRLVVGDTGRGIDPSVIEKIFDPFFTTKGPGEGTGLGLAVVHGIVSNHGGTISVSSKPGKGATFEVLLPGTEDAEDREITERKPIPTGNERILYVDDEPSIARLGRRMLERIGYQVVSTTSSIEALDTFRSEARNDAFDLVITDMTMPGMTGIDLVKELQRIQPGIPIILCTGHSQMVTPEEADLMGIRALVRKPLTRLGLAEAIRKVVSP